MKLEPITREESTVPRGPESLSTIKRLGWAFLVGAMVALLPWLVSKLHIDALGAISFLEIPGTIVALIFSGWNVHTYDPSLLVAANVLFYAGFIYALLSIREKLK